MYTSPSPVAGDFIHIVQKRIRCYNKKLSFAITVTQDESPYSEFMGV